MARGGPIEGGACLALLGRETGGRGAQRPFTNKHTITRAISIAITMMLRQWLRRDEIQRDRARKKAA